MALVDDTRGLLRALGLAIEGNKGVPADGDERVLDAEGLAIKCWLHGSSCLALYGGTGVATVDGRGFGTVLDIGSMNVLGRATVEAFLTFHYVFASAHSAEAREARHIAWVLADLLERQDFSSKDEHQKQLARERETIDSIRARLQANAHFRALTSKQQKATLEGRWRWPGWTEIGRDAGLSELLAVQVYRYVCSFAHSGSLSVLQIRQAGGDAAAMLGASVLRLINVAIAFMTTSYSRLFPEAARALAGAVALNELTDQWIVLGSDDEACVEQDVGADEVRNG